MFIAIERVVVKPVYKLFGNSFGAMGYKLGVRNTKNRTQRLQIRSVVFQKWESMASNSGFEFNYNKFGVIIGERKNLLQYNRQWIQ